MNAVAASSPSALVFKKVSARETAVVFALAAVTPMLVHLLPSWDNAPLGAHLLPMFWMTFIAVYLYGAGIGALAGLAAPLTNLLLTGLPAWKYLGVLSCELVIFALVTAWAVRRFPRIWLLAPAGYLVAKLFSTSMQAATTVFGDIGTPVSFFRQSLVNALVGLLVLAVINALCVKLAAKR